VESLGTHFKALVIGATGTIGSAFVQALKEDPHCHGVTQLSRSTDPSFTLESEASMQAAAHALSPHGPWDLIIDATGALTIDGHGPEKSLNALDAGRLMRSFEVNAIGPALLIKHFASQLANQRSIYAKLSARVGSISDNQKGGWYGYRAAKSALNMLLQTAAIEIQRKRPEAVVVALQPGTVNSPLSAPFSRGHDTVTPEQSARGLLLALDSLKPLAGAQFVDYKGQAIGW
jgi:NAD(P)-dependent dehydrogenase (short-subunit alcohol dehydrogenase family)